LYKEGVVKRLLVAAAVVAALGTASSDAQGQEPQGKKLQTLTGLVTDSMCAQSHQSNIEHARGNSGRTMTEKECTVGCVARRGQKYVLVSGDRIYQIANQDYAGLPVFAADTVKVTGTVTGNTITVSQMAAAAASKK
jgi:hypothetical protein